MTDYEKVYAADENALGEQTAAVAKALSTLPGVNLRILDVGCGQGRNALPLARQGHTVIGFDPSPTAIAQLNAAAAQEDLPLTASVSDIMAWTPDTVDVVLVDRVLHMILETDKRHAALRHLLNALAPKGAILIADEPSNMKGLRNVLVRDDRQWRKVIDSDSHLLWKCGSDH